MMPSQESDRRRRERAVELLRRLTQYLREEAERQGLTEEQLMEEIEETKRKVFKETYGNLEP